MRPIFSFLLSICILLSITYCTVSEGESNSTATAVEAPMFEVDPFWPKPLPNHWLQGATIGVAVDSRDHVWIVHRNTPDQFGARTEIGLAQDPPLSECCQPAPPVLEFDPDGNLVGAWGGPSDSGDYEWPLSNHGIEVDHMDNVWIGGNGSSDSHVLKFARDGTFLMQIGRARARFVGTNNDGRPIFERNSNDKESFGRVAKISFVADANEMYLADGYLNKRIVVIDSNTGDFKRYWGAYGNPPDDEQAAAMERYSPEQPPAPQFRGPVHCAEPSNDGLLYVCDRAADRIQVFQLDGTYVQEAFIAPETLSQGSTWDIAFSPDPEQKFIYLADGQNMKVYVIHRESMEVLYSFGDGGRQPGLFFAVHSIATDSKGNIFTTETYEGKRLQKFIYRGMGPVTTYNQGAPWPGS
jgi:hypothetical protein